MADQQVCPQGYVERLQFIRDTLTAQLKEAKGVGAAQIATALLKVLADLEGQPQGEASVVDDLAARRAADQAKLVDGAAGSVKRRAAGGGAGRVGGAAS